MYLTGNPRLYASVHVRTSKTPAPVHAAFTSQTPWFRCGFRETGGQKELFPFSELGEDECHAPFQLSLSPEVTRALASEKAA